MVVTELCHNRNIAPLSGLKPPRLQLSLPGRRYARGLRHGRPMNCSPPGLHRARGNHLLHCGKSSLMARSVELGDKGAIPVLLGSSSVTPLLSSSAPSSLLL